MSVLPLRSQVVGFSTDRPFTRVAGLRAGLLPADFRGSRFRKLFRGVYVDSGVRDSAELRVAGALCTFGASAFASHASAARILGVPIPSTADEHVTVLALEDRRSRAGIRCHTTSSARVWSRGGLRISAADQLFVELSQTLSLVDLVVAGDFLLGRGVVTLAALIECCEHASGLAGRNARRAVAYVRERVDSPMETRLRMLLILAGIPEPVVNLSIRDVDGVPVRRFDLCWPGVRVIVEYDGRHHIERESQWEADLGRREEIDDHGWRLIVVTANGIYAHPEQTVLRVWRVLRERKLAGLPVRTSEDWRPHFPSRL